MSSLRTAARCYSAPPQAVPSRGSRSQARTQGQHAFAPPCSFLSRNVSELLFPVLREERSPIKNVGGRRCTRPSGSGDQERPVRSPYLGVVVPGCSAQ